MRATIGSPRSGVEDSDDHERLGHAAQLVRTAFPEQPTTGIILGSGLSGLADEIRDGVRIKYADLPGLVCTTAAGHRGELICGTLDGVKMIAMAGRLHRYEGRSDDQVTFPVRLMSALGVGRLIVTNAAGALNPMLNVGDIVVISDHIDLAKARSHWLVSGRLEHWPQLAHESVQHRLLSKTGCDLYDRSLRRLALRAARQGDFPASLGVYLATLGPTYETRAEYRMMRSFGADVVGMSTAPEVRAAFVLGMRVLGLSLVSNVARPDAPQVTDHQEVLAAGHAAASRLRSIIAAVLHSAIG